MSPLGRIAIVAGALLLAGQIYLLLQLSGQVDTLTGEAAAARTELEGMRAEMTRYRIEQSSSGQGIHAMLEKIMNDLQLVVRCRRMNQRITVVISHCNWQLKRG